MQPSTRLLDAAPLVAAALLITLTTIGSAAAIPAPASDGWHTWRVDATAGAPNWCCYMWRNETAIAKACDLDFGNHGSMSSREDADSPQEMQIYTHIVSGEATELRALSSSCPVNTVSAITDHGRIAAGDSVAWLRRFVTPRGGLSSAALAAISVHAGREARGMLVATARSDTSLENRKDAVFWMGQARARDTAGEIRALMFNDPLAKMREHAAFSWSQSDIPNRGDALRELGATDSSEKVRGQAWFWLAQTGDAQSETAILSALDREDSRKVRNEAIFALSQLPAERGVAALITVIEDRRMSDKDRKQALFWIAQSESDRAMDYLAGVLND